MNIGIVCTWPWGVKNAESEVILRVKEACNNLGFNLYCITNDGFIVDEKFFKTNIRVDEKSLDFVIAMHYEDKKLTDTFTYLSLWNPPEITLQYPEYYFYASNMLTLDDVLIYNKKEMLEQFKTLLGNIKLDTSDASMFTASFPQTRILEPKLDNPRLFYCGTNWEVFISSAKRHEGLFKMLDREDWIDIYGPNRKHKHPWKNYKRYIGEIAFDGFSVLEKINECGICLVLSSAMHWRGNAISSRIYEACCSGAVVIVDDNEFIREHFGDSVLYIDFAPKNPQKMFEQIKNHVSWIKNNKAEALELAKKSQAIFKEKFVLEKQLTDIVNNHQNRKDKMAEAYYAKNSRAKVAAVHYIDSLVFDEKSQLFLKNSLENCEKQIGLNKKLYVICEDRIKTDVEKLTQEYKSVELISEKIFDDNDNKVLTRGELLYKLSQNAKFDYFTVLKGNENLYKDSFTQLVRAIENDNDSSISYGQYYSTDYNGKREWYADLFQNIEETAFRQYNVPNFMIDAKVFKSIDESNLKFLDFYEIADIVLYMVYKKQSKVVILNRILGGFLYERGLKLLPEMKYDLIMQIRYIQSVLGNSYCLREQREQLERDFINLGRLIKKMEKKIRKTEFVIKYLYVLGKREKYEEKLIIRKEHLDKMYARYNNLKK